jgi:homoaconitate hydratase family protein
MGNTFAEKILGRAAGKNVAAGDIVVVEPDFCLSHENGSAIYEAFRNIGVDKIHDPARIVIVFDHTVPANSAAFANAHRLIRDFVREQGIRHFYDLNAFGGVCHQIMCQEGFALPGKIIVGSDSHTCTAGAMGAFATGIGRTEMAGVWATGEIWFKVPESIRIEVRGTFPRGTSPKDLILKIIGDIRTDGADYMSVEFCGEAVGKMSIGERMTLCNMGIEMGAKNAACRPDGVTRSAASKMAKSGWEEIWADDDARYAARYEYSLDELVPGVAKPHTVDNYAPVSAVSGTKIDQAYIGTCTNGRIEDLRQAAAVIGGRKVKVRTIVTPASCAVYEQAIEEGLIAMLLKAGCTICHPGCGACIGLGGGVLGDGEVCISTANRNFMGRMGGKESQIYLASPMSVAYSALCGEIRDPREAV